MKTTQPLCEEDKYSLTLDHSSRVERQVLGCVLLINSVWKQARVLSEQHFGLHANRLIFARIRDLAESGRQIDLITLAEELGRHQELDQIGGIAYLSCLIDGLPERQDISQYLGVLREYAVRRNGAKAGEALLQLSSDGSVSPTVLAEIAATFAAQVVASDPLPPRFSEESLAQRFSRQYGAELRFVAGWGRWMCWRGTHWREDDTLAVFNRARVVCRTASAECGDAQKSLGIRLAAAATVAAVERLARADRQHAATTDQWDADPWLLNTPTGTVDLSTGDLHGHNQEQYLTKRTASGPGGGCPLWLHFLERITDGDIELLAFLQRVIGYALTGTTREHALFFCHGNGANGKSVFLSTIAGVLGDYAKTAPISAFTARRCEQHPTDLAGLRGARFVTVVETEDGCLWAEAKIKALTGGDRVTARFMRQDFFEYTPQFKLIVAGNHRPGLRNVDEAMRRRLHLIPFSVTIRDQERDPELTERLKEEYAGILQWAIEGCVAWQREGLNPPQVVRKATADYFAAEDALGRWLDERCESGAAFWSAGAPLFADWQRWCVLNGEDPRTRKWFSQTLETRGITERRTSKVRGFVGVRLQVLVTDMTDSPVDSVAYARVTPHIEASVTSVTER